jgi:Domain of unknown function (DUF4157)
LKRKPTRHVAFPSSQASRESRRETGPTTSSSVPLQRSLTMGRTDDPQEHEADRVAREALRAPEAGAPVRRTSVGGVTGATAPPIVHEVLASPGRALDGRSRGFFEPRLGLDLGAVRIHDDASAARSADAVESHAYTVGSDVVFAAGRHAPETGEGRALLAHELAHVAQREDEPTARVRRQPAESVEGQLADLQRRVALGEIRDAINAQDNHWKDAFDSRLSGWYEAIFRVTGAIEMARLSFGAAQNDQDKWDALVLQGVVTAASFGFAVALQPLLAGGLTVLAARSKAAADMIEEWTQEAIVEGAENPVLQVVGSMENVVPMALGAGTESQQPATPEAVPVGSTPTAYLTTQGEALEARRREIKDAFVRRGDRVRQATEEELAAINLETRERRYQALDADLAASADAIKGLMDKQTIADILERHIWAALIRERAALPLDPATMKPDVATLSQPESGPGRHLLPLGYYEENRLNKLGVFGLAGITYADGQFDPPYEWPRLLLVWAWTYDEGLYG